MARDLGFDVTAGLDQVRDHMADLAAIGAGAWSWWALSRRGCDLTADKTRIASVYDRFGIREQLNAGVADSGPKAFRGFPTGGDFSENNPTQASVNLTGKPVSTLMTTGWCAAVVYTRGNYTGSGDGLIGLASGGYGNLQLRGGVLQSYAPSDPLLAASSPAIGEISWAVWGYTPSDTTMRILTPGGMVSRVSPLTLSLYSFNFGGSGATVWRGLLHDFMFKDVGISAEEMQQVGQVMTNLYGV